MHVHDCVLRRNMYPYLRDDRDVLAEVMQSQVFDGDTINLDLSKRLCQTKQY